MGLRAGRTGTPLLAVGALCAVLLGAGAPAAATTTASTGAADVPVVETSESLAATLPGLERNRGRVMRLRTAVPKPAPVPSFSAPSANTGTQADPAHAPAPAPAPVGSHAFLNVTDGKPTRWNPCAPVPWQFNPAGAPSGGLAAVQAALATLSDRSGLTFRYEGTTSTVPTAGYLKQSWGSFKPLLIGWTSSSASDLLAGGDARLVGMARILWTGSYDSTGANHTQIASGVIAFNSATQAGTTGANSWYTYALHELGHVVGLGHVNDDKELMRATIPAHLSTYGNGDRQGLLAVGAGKGCMPAIR